MLRTKVLLATAATSSRLRAERGDAVRVAALDRQRKAAQGPSTALKNGHANRLAGQRVIYLEGVALNLASPCPASLMASTVTH